MIKLIIIKKKLKNERKNHGENFCAIEYYSHTCGLYMYKNVTIIRMIIVIY